MNNQLSEAIGQLIKDNLTVEINTSNTLWGKELKVSLSYAEEVFYVDTKGIYIQEGICGGEDTWEVDIL